MPDETRHESEDLQDYQVQDSTDTLSGAPGDDPLDRGVVPPERWSAGVRFGDTAAEQSEGESLDSLLAEEEPDPALDFEDDEDEDEDEDEEEEAEGEEVLRPIHTRGPPLKGRYPHPMPLRFTSLSTLGSQRSGRNASASLPYSSLRRCMMYTA